MAIILSILIINNSQCFNIVVEKIAALGILKLMVKYFVTSCNIK